MLQECASDAEQARTKANDVLNSLENYFEDTEADNELRNEALELLEPE